MSVSVNNGGTWDGKALVSDSIYVKGAIEPVHYHFWGAHANVHDYTLY